LNPVVEVCIVDNKHGYRSAVNCCCKSISVRKRAQSRSKRVAQLPHRVSRTSRGREIERSRGRKIISERRQSSCVQTFRRKRRRGRTPSILDLSHAGVRLRSAIQFVVLV